MVHVNSIPAVNSGGFVCDLLACTKMLDTISMFVTHDIIAGIGPLDRTYERFLLAGHTVVATAA